MWVAWTVGPSVAGRPNGQVCKIREAVEFYIQEFQGFLWWKIYIKLTIFTILKSTNSGH